MYSTFVTSNQLHLLEMEIRWFRNWSRIERKRIDTGSPFTLSNFRLKGLQGAEMDLSRECVAGVRLAVFRKFKDGEFRGNLKFNCNSMLAALEPCNESGARCERVHRRATTYPGNRHDSSPASEFVLITPATLSVPRRGVSYSLLVEC